MSNNTVSFARIEHIIKSILQRLEIPSNEEINMINSRLNRLEKLIYQKTSELREKRAVKETGSAADIVLDLLSDFPDGVNFKTIKAETGYEDKKLRNIIFRLDQTGRIERIGRGVYKKTKQG
ncbi:MAG: hypothetical protein R6U68_05010 [Desulfobacteraceae bacterium]